MESELKKIEQSAKDEITRAKTLDELETRRIQFLGRERGALNIILRKLKNLEPSDRAKIGSRANKLREIIESLLAKQTKELKKGEYESRLKTEWIDVTRPGKKPPRGRLHPLTRIMREIETIFASLGFTVAEGPEVETEYYNFDALNIPANHPARDMWDTFWVKNSKFEIRNSKLSDHLLLRTHTSPVQIRYMEQHNPPLRIIVPGRVYRYEATDASHETQFYQLEGLMVDKTVSIANFKSIIEHFFSRLFHEPMEVRLRPSYFPFTEPSFEVDMRPKKRAGHREQRAEWIEISGAGMVHPNVFKAAGYNPRQWQGFAFGMGIDRIAMLKYKIPDIRLFHSNDLRFLKQF